MEIRYTYEMKDFEALSETAERTWYPRRRRSRQWLVIVGALIVAIPILNGEGPLFPVPYIVGMGPLALAMVYWGLYGPRRRARQYYRSNGTEYRAIVTDEGITTFSPTVRTELQWAA